MKVLELAGLKGDDTFIYYRRSYTATAKIQLIMQTVDIKIAFTIEMDPLGQKTIFVDYPNGTDFDYPVMPITKALKTFILDLDNQGSLPSA